jgi:hypothetical protein
LPTCCRRFWWRRCWSKASPPCADDLQKAVLEKLGQCPLRLPRGL